MQNVGQSDNKKLDSKVSVTSTPMNSSSSSSNNGKIMSTPLNKFPSNNSSPAKSDTETFSEFQPRVTDSSESDEESVSEILLACLYLRPDLLVDSFPLDQNELEIPDSCSDSCDNEVDDNDEDDEEDDDDDEDDDEDDDDGVPDSPDVHRTFLLDDSPSDVDTDQVQTKARLEALLEAAANINPDKLPVIRRATLALDEAAQTLTKMRTDSSSREKNSLSRSLIAACNDNDVNAVRRLLNEGNNQINEATDDGDSLLSLACSAGYYELAQVLLAMSAQVEDRGQKNDVTPLMEASSGGHVDIIRLLISHGADVNAQSSTGNTPLMFACIGGHVEAVKELLASEANVEDHNENGHTPLMEAASAGHVEVAKILLEHGAGINTHSNEFKESALTLACYKGHLDMVRFLLEAGADQEHKTDEMHTALMEASMDGHVEVARLLLDSGAQVNMPTDSFESPLTLAACGGHVDLAMLLIERGANIEEVNDEGYTPLMEAAREGHEEMVALLLSQGANINAQTEETQETALTLACCGGFLEVADYLIKNGAKIELGASTPLMEAAQEGHIELVKFLLENEAHVHAQTQTGDTALTYACENGHTDVAEVLLYYNAELEHESEGGRTPLMKACRAGHICTVKFLIGRGADVNRQTTNNDHTPLSLACAGGHQQVVELLLKNGADPFHKLKDNSTMLIEAAKGGHIAVVQLLLDYPHSMANNVGIGNNIATNNTLVQTQQLQQSYLLQQQQQQQQQSKATHIIPQAAQHQINAPPGLHEVPEAVRVSNQQLFHQQQIQPSKDANFDQQPQPQLISNSQIVATSTGNIILDPSSVRQVTQPESILTQMRLLQMTTNGASFCEGFNEGLAHGLATRAKPPSVNQISANGNTIVSQNNTTANLTASTANKQKSLLRHKNRQVPSSFESNLTTSEAQQVRSQPVGEDENSIYLTTNSISEQDVHQHKKLLQEYQKLDYSLPKGNIQLICDTNGPPTTLLPSTAYVDITTSAGQVVKPSDNTFFITASSLPQTIQQQSTTTQSQLNLAVSTTTHISAPSEVSQNTAISDRPKVKPVSKKDGKNLRKAATVLQQNQMVSIYNNLPAAPSSDNLQILQQSLANLSLQHQQSSNPLIPQTSQTQTFSQVIGTSQGNEITTESSLQSQTIVNSNNRPTTATSSTQQLTIQSNNLSNLPINPQSSMILTEAEEQQFNPDGFSKKLLQMVAANQSLQKIVQHYCYDQPKSPSESPPSDPIQPSSPTKPSNNSDLADLSRIFCEVMQDIKSELTTAQDYVQVHQHNNQPKGVIGIPQYILQHQNTKLNTNQSPGNFIGENDDQLHMFTVEDHDTETMTDCIYPPLDESLDSFNPDDVATVAAVVSTDDGNRDSCNYEWVDYLDEELAATLSPQEYEAYSTLCGNYSLCKARWHGHRQWPSQQSILALAENSLPSVSEQLQQANSEMTIDQQLQQQLQQQLSVEQLQLLSHLQNQHNASLSIIPTSAIEQHLQTPNTFTLTSLPTHLTTPTSVSSITQSTSTSTGEMPQQTSNLADAQQQAKLVFNVETDKSSPPLQLYLQIPQGQQAQQNNANLCANQSEQQQVISTQTIAQTQTGLQIPQNTIVLPSNFSHQNSNLQQQPQIMTTQIQGQHCNLHSQVQVATQTQQTPNSSALTPVVSSQISQNLIDTNLIPPISTKSCISSDRPSKKGSEKPRKDKNRYSSIRQAPAGQQQQVSQFPVGGPTAAPQEKTIDVDSETDSNHDTALTLACAGGHEELVELLISRGACIEHRDKKGFTPLILAATAGHEKVVEALLKHGADLEAQSERTKDTPLSLACSGGRYEVVELLLNVGANKEHRNVSDYTPLSLAASGGYVNIIKLLLSHGAEINSRTGSKLGISPLMLAAMNGHTAAVKLLLDMGSDINAQIETNRNTALTLACFQGRHEVVSLLLDRKANVEHRAKTGLTPLMEAASGGYIEVGRVLLDKGADVNAAPVPSSRDTALTIAADKGHIKFVELLLLRGAAVEVKNKKGNSPLWLAANGGHLQVVEVLYNSTADIDSQDNRKVSCLMAAFRKGHTKVVKWMVNHVTQFPSDQEMTRYISTVSDKELLEKCHECVKIIRAAKEAQAVKANKNASILLEELDMEKTREESRRAAAARRRERKKKKKLEKKEKRKMIEMFNTKSTSNKNDDEKDDDDEDDDDDKEDESDREDSPNIPPVNIPDPPNQNDKEEGDSGIDANSHSSCSSANNDGKSNNQNEKNINSNKSKKKKNNKDRISRSPEMSIPEVSKKKEDSANNTNKSNKNNKNLSDSVQPQSQNIEKPHQANQSKVTERKDYENKNNFNKTKDKVPVSEKENQATKDLQQHQNIKNNKMVDKKSDALVSVTSKIVSDNNVAPNNTNNNNRKSFIYEISRHHTKDLESDQIVQSSNSDIHFNNNNNNTNQTSQKPNKKNYHDDSNKNVNSPKQQHNNKREDSGWKEVVRKSSMQQQPITTTPTEQLGCKKVQVSAHAISRVIGRAGSNINAIRAATGAHIEVEKQGKAQGDRCITIKGSPEATKQASNLIGTLIKDPDVDILSMLPRPHLKPIVPTGTSIWEKSTPLPAIQTIATSNVKVSKPINNNVTSNASAAKTTTTMTLVSSSFITSTTKSTSVMPSISASSRSQQSNVKNTFTSTQSRSSTIVSNSNQINSNIPKRLITSSSSISLSNASKSNPAFTNPFMSVRNTFKNSTNVSATPPGTFASKLSTDNNKKVFGSNSGSTQQNSIIPQSPSKHHGAQGGLPAPFTSNNINTNSQSSSNMGAIIKPPFSQSNTQDSSNNCHRSITPIGQPISSSRNVTPSPLLHQTTSTASTSVNISCVITPSSSSNTVSTTASVIQPPVPALASQFKSKINQLQHGNAQAHEYSLFNDSYSNQWDSKQYNSNNNKQFIENTPPQVDAAKAPGYRGTAVSSPVSSKASSNATTPPSQMNQNCGAPSHAVSSNVANSNQVPQQHSNHTNPIVSNTIHCDINKVAQSQILQTQNSGLGLAVQRPIINNQSNQMRQIDAFGISGNGVHSSSRQNMFDQLPTNNTGQTIAPQLINYGQQQPEQMQQIFHPNLATNPLHMSRLNPRASSFSSMHPQTGMQGQNKAPGPNQQQQQQQQHPNQSYGSIFHPNAGNNYQKMSNLPYSAVPPGPNRSLSQPQGNNNARWFGSDLGHLTQREILNIENGLGKNLGSPAMSPNTSQGMVNGVMPNQQQQSIQEDGRKPRPIGTERANWKHFAVGSGVEDIIPGTTWILEKQQLQQQQQQQQQQQPQMPPAWMSTPHAMQRNHYVEDMPPPQHPQEHYSQWPMEYAHMGPNQTNMNLIQSLQYAPFTNPNELAPQLSDKIEQWVEPEKQGWPGKFF